MLPSARLLARLLPLALPLTVACGAKSELLSEDPDEGAAGRAGSGGSAGRAGGAGTTTTSTGGNTSTAGAGGTVSTTGGNGGSGTLSVGGSGGTATTRELPPCAVMTENCPTFCYVGSADEMCLPSFPEEPVHERFGCAIQIAGATTAPGQKPGECCYIVGFCGGGRPLFSAGQALVAPLERVSTWT